jgi:hypothetical protein
MICIKNVWIGNGINNIEKINEQYFSLRKKSNSKYCMQENIYDKVNNAQLI